jgi:translation initiation factor 1
VADAVTLAFPVSVHILEQKMKSSSNSGLVYSTESGRMCPACRQPVSACACKAKAAVKGDGVVRVSLQTKGRGGKSVTIVKGLALDAAALAQLGKQLRTACGSGGTVKDGVIEVQGDHCELIMETLAKLGHRPKRAGG